MQHEGRGKAAKVDKNVSQWTKICRSTVILACTQYIFEYKVGARFLKNQVQENDLVTLAKQRKYLLKIG